MQSNSFNRSRLSTVLCVPLTSNMRWADAAGNVTLDAATTGLPKDSVANVAQLHTVDRRSLTERICRLPEAKLDLIFFGIDVVLGR